MARHNCDDAAAALASVRLSFSLFSQFAGTLPLRAFQVGMPVTVYFIVLFLSCLWVAALSCGFKIEDAWERHRQATLVVSIPF